MSERFQVSGKAAATGREVIDPHGGVNEDHLASRVLRVVALGRSRRARFSRVGRGDEHSLVE